MKRKNLAGRIFGRLTVVRFNGKNSVGNLQWMCVCECGAHKSILSSNLLSGATVSCGCKQAENRKKHGFCTHTSAKKEYRSWIKMRRRCLTKEQPTSKNYRERGITVCKRWNSFINFISDMGMAPSEKHTLERINNNLGYFPRNCRWATRYEQAINRRTNRLVSIDGEIHPAMVWAKRVGLSIKALYYRLDKGWPPKKAVFTPIRKKFR